MSGYMVIGQVAEWAVIGLVPLAVHRFGVKKTMIIGAAAWAIRFGLSAYGKPNWLMITTIGLHGFAFGFFFVVAQMYVDRAAGPDIKASAQNLLIFVIYGLGTILGSVLTGYVRSYFQDDWHKIWAGPTILTLICILFFAAHVPGHRAEEADRGLGPSRCSPDGSIQGSSSPARRDTRGPRRRVRFSPST